MMQDSLKSSRHQSAQRNSLTQFRLGLLFLAFFLILGGAMPAEAAAQRDFPRPGLPIGDDIALGGTGSDVFFWAPGGGSDALLAGEGSYDAIEGV